MHDIQLSASMPGRYAHVVQLRLTGEEWRVIAEMAHLRRMSVEELLREGLRLSGGDQRAPEQERAARLRLLAPESS